MWVWELVLQVGEDWMLVLTVHLTLLEKGKCGLESIPRADILEAVQDLLILTVLLMSKLVAREAEDHQAPGEAALQLIELGVVPGGCASERGHVLNQHCPASEGINPGNRVDLILNQLKTTEELMSLYVTAK